MADDNKSLRKFKKIVFYGAAALGSVVSLIMGYGFEYLSRLENPYVNKHVLEALAHISNEVGVAFFIAIVLAFTIEKLTFEEFREMHEKQMAEIKGDVMHYIFEHIVPKEITDIIETQILKAVFVRRGLIIDYTIAPINDSPAYSDYVKVTLTLTYSVENLTSEPRHFDIKHSVEVSPEPTLSRQVKFTSIKVTGCRNPFSKGEKELADVQQEEDMDLVLAFEGIEIDPGEHHRTKVVVTSQTIKHLKGGVDYHILRHHTCDIKLIVHVLNLDLDVYSGIVAHVKMKDENISPAIGYYHWTAEHPLLAGQNIYVTWMPTQKAIEAKLSLPSADKGNVTVEQSDRVPIPSK